MTPLGFGITTFYSKKVLQEKIEMLQSLCGGR
jgi:hypothetical protein